MYLIRLNAAAALCLGLCVLPAFASGAEDVPPSDPTLAHDQAKTVSDSVKHSAKTVAAATQDTAKKIAHSAKAVAHEVAAAAKEGAHQVAATAKKGAEKTKAAVNGEKTATP